MRYVILLAMLLCLPVQGEAWQVVGGGAASAPAGDTCIGTQLFAAHFENNDDVTQGTPAGCVVSGGDSTVTKSNVTYSTTQKSDGSYSAYSTVENSQMTIDSTNMDVSSTGTWCADVYYTQTVNRVIVDLYANGPKAQVAYVSGANNFRVYYGSDFFTSTSTFPNDTFTRLCSSWDTSQSAGSDKLAVKVGSSAWEERTDKTLTYTANAATYRIAGGSYQYWGGYIDNVKLYSDYKHVE